MSNLKSLFGTQDMTVGRPLSVLARFSVPLLIGNFTQQLYNTADSIIVGRYIGDTALAAASISGRRTGRRCPGRWGIPCC